MRAAAGAYNSYKICLRAPLRTLCIAWMLILGACSSGMDREPLVEFSTELVVSGAMPPTVARRLEAGTYLLEIRERDIDLRVQVDAGNHHGLLADSGLRHGVHRTVIRIDAPASLRLTLRSVDPRSWKGAAAVRILRWPNPAPDAPPDNRLRGFEALGESGALIARDNADAWRAAHVSLHEAARYFQAAGDTRSLAETEYQRGFVEHDLLRDFESSRRSATAALTHFRVVNDAIGMQRAAMLLGLAELDIAGGRAGSVPHAELREQVDTAKQRLDEARQYFEAQNLQSDALQALEFSQRHGEIFREAASHDEPVQMLLRRARQRGDSYHEARAMLLLGRMTYARDDADGAAVLFERAGALVDHARMPELHATLLSHQGLALALRGEFDRAGSLHSEALRVFSARGESGLVARELAALASIQFQTGNSERALDMLEEALPMFAAASDPEGHVSTLRLAGNVAATLGRHPQAIQYLREAEQLGRFGAGIENTRILIARELRQLGNLQGAEVLLQEILDAGHALQGATRADAHAERAQLRMRQQRHREALQDLRIADTAYLRLKLDLRRIDSSSNLSLALLDAGDIAGAGASADIAVKLEQRLRAKAGAPDVRARFLSARYAPYEARIEALLATASFDRNAAWRAFRAAEAVRAGALAERLTLGEPSVDSRRRIDDLRLSLDSRHVVQSLLPADTAVLSFFVGDRRSHAWLLTARELRHGVLPGRQVLEEAVTAAIAAQRTGVASTQTRVFGPLLENLLQGVGARRLLILPDGPLHGMPFATLQLPRSRDGKLLVDRFVIAGAPSLAIALRAAPAGNRRTHRVALVFDPVYTPDDRRLTVATDSASRFRGSGHDGEDRPLARLPYSAVEARAVRRAFEGAQIIELTGFDATAHRVLALPPKDLDVLHFATHAVARADRPEASALFLSEFAADGSTLPMDRLTADDISRSGLRAGVVVLSGCATGDGRELRGEGVLGLAYGFLANGSHTVVASLWPVEDAFTARFMEEFYAAFKATGKPADALRLAQLRTRDIGGPSVWSSFVVRSNGMP